MSTIVNRLSMSTNVQQLFGEEKDKESGKMGNELRRGGGGGRGRQRPRGQVWGRSSTAPKNNNWTTGPTDITFCRPSAPLEVKQKTGNEEEEVQ